MTENHVSTEKKLETLLLVDDEESILEVAGEYFTIKGYQVLTATNGREAVSVLANQRVDCCFTDINMPEMDGLELAEHIRKIDNSVPVIIMTGYPSLENTIRTLKNGVVDFLIKPVNLNQMEICVRRVLRERKLFAENILLKSEVAGKERLERLNLELTSKVDELNTLNKIMADFTSVTSSTDLLERIVKMATDITRANDARFYLINAAMSDPLEVACNFSGEGQSPANLNEITGLATTRPATKLIHEVVTDEIPLLVSDARQVQGLSETVGSFMAVPMKIRNKVFGVLSAAAYVGTKTFSEKDLYYLSFMTQNAANTIENLALYENIYENLFATLFAFVKAVEARDSYTQQHSSRVTNLAIKLGRELGCTPEELEVLSCAGQLHDIGKIGIRDEILLKPGKLTDSEFEIIKSHPVIGAKIISQLGMWEQELRIVRSHHERFDGTGYPDGLKGGKIPRLARILSVCDAYDAMASNRVYRKKMEPAKIISILHECAGTQFDPEMVAAFVKLHAAGIIEAEYVSTDHRLTEHSPGLLDSFPPTCQVAS
ncbi:MAG: response regulator [Desulfobacterales bacterium]|nr:response regulator [Desulfobacterales bacterium]